MELVTARLVEDAVCFSSMKRKMLDWQGESKKMRTSAAEELLCSGIMKAAVEKSKQDQGKGFTLSKGDLQGALGFDEKVFNSLFNDVAGKVPCKICKSESLQRFARSFGYSMSVKTCTGQDVKNLPWANDVRPLCVGFTPAH